MAPGHEQTPKEAPMDAVTPKNNKHDTLDTHSHLVRPAEM